MRQTKYFVLRSMAQALLVAIFLFTVFIPHSTSRAASNLTIRPITWNVIGLDSNNVNVGPDTFPVGARVCNPAGNGDLTDVTSTFVWDSADAYIDFRPGSRTSYSDVSIPAGECVDLYYEVQVERNKLAYDHTRRYHITAGSAALGLGTVSTPAPREVYVEYLVSQNRNTVSDVQLSTDCTTFNSVAAGGVMSLLVGNTYCIKLVGSTSTNGYEQLESFISFPNTTFQVNWASTTYSADGGTDPRANSKLYADGCTWVNDPTSPNYRSCVSVGKYGGNVAITYNVTIIGGGGTEETLNTLLYDFSGSSYHYNSDFTSSLRYVAIIDPSNLTFSKSFSPDTTVAGGTSTLTFSITNPNQATITGVKFTDPLLAGMKVASPATYSTSGCGTPTFAPAANDVLLDFSNGTLAPNGSCSISVRVEVPSTPTSGTYNNISNPLFVNDLDTGKTASADLDLTTGQTGTDICGVTTLATWIMDPSQGTTVPPLYWTKDPPNVAEAIASSGNGLTSLINTGAANGNPANSWSGNTGLNQNTANPDTSPYFQFEVDTSNYTSANITLDFLRTSDWNAANNRIVVYSSTTGAAGSFAEIGRTPMAVTWTNATYNAAATGANKTYFRITGIQANNNSATMYLDNILLKGTGCTTPVPPKLTKAFDPNPIAVGATSLLTFTLQNTNASLPLTEVTFTDALPAGLEVAANPQAATNCSGTPTWSPAAGDTTLTFGIPDPATIPADDTCTASVYVTATTSGPHTNVSGFITSKESGTNATSSGSATATLTAMQPPSIAKLFSPNPILTDGISTLTFTIANPNLSDNLPNVAFTDVFPAGLGNMVVADPPNAATSGCGAPTFAPAAGAGSISFSNGTIAAGGACTVSVDVTATAADEYPNTSSNVTAIVSGVTITGNTASDTLTVNDPHPSVTLLKQIAADPAGPWTTFVTVIPGAQVHYRFIVENTGDVPLSPVSVSDPGFDLSSCAWPATLPVASPTQDPTVTCQIGPFIAAEGDHPNRATAHATYNDKEYTDTSTASYIGALPGFSLLKQISTSAGGPWTSSVTVAPSTNVYYKFTIINTGATDLTELGVTDLMIDVNTLAANCVFPNTLAVNGVTTCVVGPVAASATDGTYTNTATAHGTSLGEPQQTDPSSAEYIVSSALPDLGVDKSNDAANPAFVGVPFVWTITVSNSGADSTFDAGETILTDPLPAGADYANVTTTNGAIAPTGAITCSVTTGTLTCSADTGGVNLPDGASFTVTMDVTPTSATHLDNIATVDPDANVIESDEDNNTANNSVTVTAKPDLSIQKVNNANSPANVGDTFQWTITVTNSGSAAAFNTGDAIVTDPLPAGATYANPVKTNGAVPPVGTIDCAIDGTNTLACSAGTGGASMDAGASFSIRVDVMPTAAATLTNTAEVDPGQNVDEGNELNNSASNTVTVQAPPPDADLSLTKTNTTPGVSIVGTSFQWILSLRNAGSSSATFTSGQVLLLDNLPANAIYKTPAVGEITNVTDPDNIACSVQARQLTCAASSGNVTIEPNGGFTVHLTVAPTEAGSLTNTASADPDNHIPESDEANNAGTNSVRILERAGTGSGDQNITTLPKTGFAAGVRTLLPNQPEARSYTAEDGLLLEIPRLGVKLTIVGVPLSNGTWDVTWLTNQAGWLNGTAYPTWSGNSVLTSHVYLANGQPGPFHSLKDLKWGDQIVIHAYGQRHIYEVRENLRVRAEDVSAIKHETQPWVTLLTCQEYDASSNTYLYRVMVRAVLVKVEQK